MDPVVTPMLIASTVVSTVGTVASISASAAAGASSIAAGRAQAAGLEQQARAKELQTKYLDVQIDQTAAASREEVNKALSSIEAVRAARGTMARAGEAIENEVVRRGRRNEYIQILGIRAQRSALLAEAASLRGAKSSAVLAGHAGALSSFADAASLAGSLLPSGLGGRVGNKPNPGPRSGGSGGGAGSVGSGFSTPFLGG